MKEKFLEYGITITDEQQEKFENYYRLLTFYNDRFNITAITEKNEVIEKHFIDSCLGNKLLTKGLLIDVGAGGGFPSIPLKILNPELKMVLLEATGKKCEFLREVVKELNLLDVEVINGRAEDLAKTNKRESFDFCVARAVARLNTLSEYCMPFIKVGGSFIAYKGDATEELNEAQNAIKILGGKVDKVLNLTLNGAKRDIIKIDKIKSTDKKYPRGNGKERKNPLWKT